MFIFFKKIKTLLNKQHINTKELICNRIQFLNNYIIIIIIIIIKNQKQCNKQFYINIFSFHKANKTIKKKKKNIYIYIYIYIGTYSKTK